VELIVSLLQWTILGVGLWLSFGWAAGIRRSSELMHGTVMAGMFFTLATLGVIVFGLSPFHLLWLLPAALVFGFLSQTPLLSWLTPLGRLYWYLCKVGR
jgi:hypothetical protein